MHIFVVTDGYGGQFLREFFPRESRIGSSLREFRIIEGSRNRG